MTNYQAIGSPIEICKGKLIRIVHQRYLCPDGNERIFEVAERAPGVRIIVTDKSRILLIHEWRTEYHDWDIRLPGGKVYDCLDKYLEMHNQVTNNIRDIARKSASRELEEETMISLTPDALTFFHRSICGATMTWDLFYFIARCPEIASGTTNKVLTEEGEDIEPRWYTFDEVVELCINCEIKEDRTAAVLLRAIKLGCI